MSVCECVYKSIPPHIYFSLLLLLQLAVVAVLLLLFLHKITKQSPSTSVLLLLLFFSPLIETVEVNSFSYHLSTSSFNFLLLIFLPPGVSPISLSLSAVIQDTHTDKQVREKNLYKIIIPTVEHFEKKNNFQDNPKKIQSHPTLV